MHIRTDFRYPREVRIGSQPNLWQTWKSQNTRKREKTRQLSMDFELARTFRVRLRIGEMNVWMPCSTSLIFKCDLTDQLRRTILEFTSVARYTLRPALGMTLSAKTGGHSVANIFG